MSLWNMRNTNRYLFVLLFFLRCQSHPDGGTDSFGKLFPTGIQVQSRKQVSGKMMQLTSKEKKRWQGFNLSREVRNIWWPKKTFWNTQPAACFGSGVGGYSK
jgi:hypothetical protein